MALLRGLALPLAGLLASLIVSGLLTIPRLVELRALTQALERAEDAQRAAADVTRIHPHPAGAPDLEFRYDALAAAGVWDSAVRGHLHETLRDADVTDRLQRLDYQIAARQPASELDGQFGELTVYRTPLRVKATVLHEVAFLDALTTLTGRHAGLLHIDECRLRRSTKQQDDAPALGIDCQLTAYSVALRNEARP